MPTFTKTVSTDDGEQFEITRTTTDPGEAVTLRVTGWTQTDDPEPDPDRDSELRVRAIVPADAEPAAKPADAKPADAKPAAKPAAGK